MVGGRVGGALVRLFHYVVGRRLDLWLMLMADDMDMELAPLQGSSYDIRHGFLTLFFVASVVGIPIAWKKLKGGVPIEWIGYVLYLSSYAVGISERRAEWCVK